jgi:hypothetical protein
LLQQEPSGIFE